MVGEWYRIIFFKILTLPKSFILKIDITFISDTWCRFDYHHLHQYTVHALEPVILILDKPHHLLLVITINYSQSDNPPQPYLILVNHTKTCYTLGSPKPMCNTVRPILIIFIFPFSLLPLFLVSQRVMLSHYKKR